jgi:hypothetical protein
MEEKPLAELASLFGVTHANQHLEDHGAAGTWAGV